MAITDFSIRTTASTSGRTSRRTNWLFLWVVCGIALAAYLSPDPATANDKRLAVYATSACYNNPEYDTVTIVDFPFTFNRSGLDFFRPDSTDPAYFGRIFAQVTLYDSTAMPVDSANTYFSVRIDDLLQAESTAVMVFNKLTLVVKPGLYTANLTVIDAVSKRTGNVFLKSVVASAPQRSHLEIGGPLLAHRIARVRDSVQAEDRLVKSGFKIWANPTGTFSTEDTICYLYAELYNLVQNGSSPKYQVHYAILDTLGEVVQDFGFTERDKPGQSAVVVQPLDIGLLGPAKYRLRVIASDPASAQSDTAVLQLQRMQPRAAGDFTPAVAGSDPYDSLSLQEKINLARYMLGPDQMSILNRLTDQGKENFLEQYWREHDIEPLTPVIENRVEMIRRYHYANQHFSRLEGRKDGWESDRGRIYMVWGPWDDILDVPTPRTGNPFSIWYYRRVKEGQYFVFEDLRGDEEFTLVHSNVDEERHSDFWTERMKDELLDQF